MEIVHRIKVHPTTKTGTTKDDVVSQIRNMHRMTTYTSSSLFGSGIANDKTVIVYILEKKRPVKVQSKRAVYVGQKGNVRKTKIEERGHWVGRAFAFNIEQLQMVGLKVRQGTRTFKIIDKDGNKMSIQEYKKMYG